MISKISVFLVVLVAVSEAYCPTSCGTSGCGECEVARQQSCCHIFNRQQCNLCPSPYTQQGYGVPVAAVSSGVSYPEPIYSAPSYPAIPINSAASYPALPVDVASAYNGLPLNTGYSGLSSNVALPYNNLAPSYNGLSVNVASPYNGLSSASYPDVTSLYGAGAYPSFAGAYPGLNTYSHQLAGAPAQTFPLYPVASIRAPTYPISRVGKQMQPGLQPDGSIHIPSAVPQKDEQKIEIH